MNLKNRLAKFFWEHSSRKKPMIPAGTVDTAGLNSQIEEALRKLEDLLLEDPDAFRKMQIMSYYRHDSSPDFNEDISAFLYVARHCYMYGLLYYLMYRLLIPVLQEENIHELKILSSGCGSMIDALSLSLALNHLKDSYKVHYTGIDIAKWPVVFPHPFENSFIQKPIQDYWEDCKSFEGNILFFPTVISELHEYPDETGQLCRAMEQTEFTQDTIFLLVTYRSNLSFNRDWQITDWQKIQRIISVLEKKGYDSSDIPFSLPNSWKSFLHSDRVMTEDGRSRLRHYISAPYGKTSIRIDKVAPDFFPSDKVEEYLAKPGLIRKNCPYYEMRRDQYLKNNNNIRSDKEDPETICRKQCPIMCKLYPRIFFSGLNGPCFQLFVLKRPDKDDNIV